jgi:hypothetical protein
MSGRGALSLVWLGLVFALGAGAHAEMYKCQGADGKTLFTSDRSLCPRAALHESSGRIQRSEGAAPEPRAPRGERRPDPARLAAEGDAEAQAWRGKRASAEAELEQARARRAALHQVAGWCNRGHEVWAEDADGLRHGVDCDDVAAQQKALRREERRLEAYLAEGLEEECRSQGCLPGWIR